MATISDSPRSHYGALFGARGRDTITLRTEPGEWYLNATISLLETKGNSGARVVSEPAVHAAGDLTFVVSWWYSALGNVRYQLSAHTEPVPSGVPAPRTRRDQAPTQSHTSWAWWVARGSDTATVSLPPGFSFKSAVLVVQKSALFASAAITSQPAVGARGQLSFQTNWVVALGTVSYHLEVTSEG
jgi:hypothetical protein